MKPTTDLNLSINITTNMSLWGAIKLRIAGIEYIHEYIDRELKQKEGPRDISQNVHSDVVREML